MKSKKIIIDINRCKGCGVCIISCPNKCLTMSDCSNALGNKFVILKNESKCRSCGICSTVCPEFHTISIENES